MVIPCHNFEELGGFPVMLSSTMPAAKLCHTEFSIRQKNEEVLDRYENVESPNVARFRFYFRYQWAIAHVIGSLDRVNASDWFVRSLVVEVKSKPRS
jgi:hypothetical protein